MYDAPSEPSDNDKHIPQVAQFGIYLLAWEHSIRKQAARTLGSLAHYITIGRLSSRFTAILQRGLITQSPILGWVPIAFLAGPR